MTFRQGDIIKFNFSPTLGHEQSGYRPAVVISRELFNVKTRQVVVCPITTASRNYPTRVPLDDSTETQGFVICDHIKTIDIDTRKPMLVERLGENVLDKILSTVNAIIQRD